MSEPSPSGSAPAAPAGAVPRTVADLARLLGTYGRQGPPRIGVELELGLLRSDGLGPVAYEGPAGVGALLAGLAEVGPWPTPVTEGENVIALKGAEFESITLEPGGQLELVTPPLQSLAALSALLEERLDVVARVAEGLGIVPVVGSMVPIDPAEVCWMPKARYAIMRAHFEALGDAGGLHRTMMGRTTSVQVTVDYADGDDAAELLRLGFLLAPVATALFANSPLEEAGVLSARAASWLAVDPARCGEVAAAAAPGRRCSTTSTTPSTCR